MMKKAKQSISRYALARLRRGRIKEMSALIAAGIILAGLVAFIIIYLTRVNSIEVDEKLYQYYTGIRYEYDGEKRFLADTDGRVYIEKEDEKEYLDDIPLYYESSERIIIPNNMVYVSPNSLMPFKQAQFLTEIEYNADDMSLLYYANDKEGRLNNGFLFNGKDVYVFLEPVQLIWKGKVIDLARFSYVELLYNDELRAYSYADDRFYMYDIETEKVEASCISGYTINLQADILAWSDGREVMLFTEPAILMRLDE